MPRDLLELSWLKDMKHMSLATLVIIAIHCHAALHSTEHVVKHKRIRKFAVDFFHAQSSSNQAWEPHFPLSSPKVPPIIKLCISASQWPAFSWSIPSASGGKQLLKPSV